MLYFLVALVMVVVEAVFEPADATPVPGGDLTAASTEENVTVIYKNQGYPVLEPLVFERCAVEDCSDT